MELTEILLLALGVSMDAFAVSIAKGISAARVRISQALCAGLWFGGFQAFMPLLGYYIGGSFAGVVEQWDHWVAFILLALIGGNMIREALWGESEKVSPTFSLGVMLPLAIATSIDALAVGISLACLHISIWMPIAVIGLTTAALSIVGVWLGKLLGLRFSSKATLLGGLVLIAIGIKILLTPEPSLLPANKYAQAIATDVRAIVIDVRTSQEYAEGHIEGAKLMDVLQDSTFRATVDTLNAHYTYYIYCRSGRRSQRASTIMRERGLKVIDLEGGYEAWKEYDTKEK